MQCPQVWALACRPYGPVLQFSRCLSASFSHSQYTQSGIERRRPLQFCQLSRPGEQFPLVNPVVCLTTTQCLGCSLYGEKQKRRCLFCLGVGEDGRVAFSMTILKGSFIFVSFFFTKKKKRIIFNEIFYLLDTRWCLECIYVLFAS